MDRRERVADALEHEVAERVPVAVVERLEVIEIEEDERERPPELHAEGDLHGESLVEVGAIVEAGQCVDLRPLRQEVLRSLHPERGPHACTELGRGETAWSRSR